MFRSVISNGLTLSIAFLLCLMFTSPVLAQGDVRFTKYNIHAQGKDAVKLKASFANFTDPGAGHVIIPAGTEIQIKKHGWKGFVFTYDGGSKTVTFEFQEKRMGMTMDEYLEKITSSQPVKLTGLSAQDKKGVTEGQAFKGMTREGVMTALGYPAAHKTPSLDAKTWIYWTNRYKTIAVEFDDKGKVSQVRR